MRQVTFTIAIAGAAAGACGGPSYVRGSDKPDIDEYAMSTGLDKRDIDKLFEENLGALRRSVIAEQWKRDNPVVAIFPITNETSEHVDSQLQALLSKMETVLVNETGAQVVSYERQKQLVAEVEKQRGGAYDPANSASYGRQLGAKYFVTGKLHDSAERTGGERRVQYFLFMQVVDVETAAIRWQNEASLTKALVN